MNKEDFKDAYEDFKSSIIGCCDPWMFDLEEIDGICPECGCPTSEGSAAFGCGYSPVECEKCGWAPCDLSC